MNVEKSVKLTLVTLGETLPEYYLTDMLPNLCVRSNNHDDGLTASSVYFISPLAQIQILANKQTDKTHTSGQGRGPAVYLWCCQAILCLYFDRWQLYYCLASTQMYYISCTSLQIYFTPTQLFFTTI